MMLSPADINNKQFSTTRLKEGYDQNEVDSFLDDVQKDYEFLRNQVLRLEEENRTLRRINAANSEAPTAVLDVRPDPPSVVAQKLLEAAEQAAREHEAEGKAKADEIVREAGARGARIVEEASEAAERLKSEGLAEKYRKVELLEAKERKLQEKVDTLVHDGSQARRALQAAVAAYDKETSL